MTKKEEILIFTGAGFSKAMSPDFPTTAEMYDKIFAKYDPDLNDGVVHEIFSRYNLRADNFNYLKIKTLDDLDNQVSRSHAKATPSNLTAEAFMQRLQKTQNSIKELMTSGGNFSFRGKDSSYSMGGNCDDYLDFLQEFMHNINKAVYKQLDCRKWELAERGQECRQFLENIQSSYSVTIFSTNYDNFFKRKVYSPEEWRYYLKPDEETVDLSKFLTQAKPFTYVPLKGILEWFRYGNNEIRESSQHADTDLPLTISLEHVGQPEVKVGEFKSFYEHFESRISVATYLIFIGFSFNGDSYINNLILDNLQPHQKMIIITDGEINQRFLARIRMKLGRRSNYIYDIHGFNEKSQSKILKFLGI